MDVRMYPDDGGLKAPVRSWEETSKHGWEHIRKMFGFPPSDQPFLPFADATFTASLGCSKCGIKFTDPMGRAVPMGYCCPRNDCPTQARVTS
jgi:hypothetical protein